MCENEIEANELLNKTGDVENGDSKIFLICRMLLERMYNEVVALVGNVNDILSRSMVQIDELYRMPQKEISNCSSSLSDDNLSSDDADKYHFGRDNADDKDYIPPTPSDTSAENVDGFVAEKGKRKNETK